MLRSKSWSLRSLRMRWAKRIPKLNWINMLKELKSTMILLTNLRLITNKNKKISEEISSRKKRSKKVIWRKSKLTLLILRRSMLRWYSSTKRKWLHPRKKSPNWRKKWMMWRKVPNNSNWRINNLKQLLVKITLKLRN